MPMDFSGLFGGLNPFTGGSDVVGNLNMSRVRANMNPFMNSWDGDTFNIGKPQVNGGPGNPPPVRPPPAPTPTGGGGGGLQPGGTGGINPFMLASMGAGMMGGSAPRMQVSDLNPMAGGPMGAPTLPQMPPAVTARRQEINPFINRSRY